MTDTRASDLEAMRDAHSRGFDHLIGLDFQEFTADRVVATVAVKPELLQPYGILHGGVLCTIVETLGSTGAAIWYADRGNVVGVSNSTDFLRATRSGTLTGVATPVHRGRTQQLWLVEIRDESDRLVARGQLRVANIDDADRLAGGPGS